MFQTNERVSFHQIAASMNKVFCLFPGRVLTDGIAFLGYWYDNYDDGGNNVIVQIPTKKSFWNRTVHLSFPSLYQLNFQSASNGE